MRRLYQRLQLYGLVLSVSLLILWMVVPKTRSHTISVAPPIKNSVQRREVIAKLDHTELLYLKTLFKKADTTSDGKLAVNELTWAIQKTVAKHIQDAMRSNPRTFFKLDKIIHNGQVDRMAEAFSHRTFILSSKRCTQHDGDKIKTRGIMISRVVLKVYFWSRYLTTVCRKITTVVIVVVVVHGDKNP